MLDTAFVLIVITALLVIVGVCQPLAAYLKLPPPVLLGVVGVASGGFPAVMSQLGWSSRSDPFPGAKDVPADFELQVHVIHLGQCIMPCTTTRAKQSVSTPTAIPISTKKVPISSSVILCHVLGRCLALAPLST